MAKLNPDFCERLAGLIDSDVEIEVEKRCRDWLAKTQGIDFANLLTKTAAERDEARREFEQELRRSAALQKDVNDLKDSLMQTADNLATAMIEITSMRDFFWGNQQGTGHSGKCAPGCQCPMGKLIESRRVVPFKSP